MKLWLLAICLKSPVTWLTYDRFLYGHWPWPASSQFTYVIKCTSSWSQVDDASQLSLSFCLFLEHFVSFFVLPEKPFSVLWILTVKHFYRCFAQLFSFLPSLHQTPTPPVPGIEAMLKTPLWDRGEATAWWNAEVDRRFFRLLVLLVARSTRLTTVPQTITSTLISTSEPFLTLMETICHIRRETRVWSQ